MGFNIYLNEEQIRRNIRYNNLSYELSLVGLTVNEAQSTINFASSLRVGETATVYTDEGVLQIERVS